MRRHFLRSLVLLPSFLAASCNGSNADPELAIMESADAAGVEITARSRVDEDSIRVATQFTNTLDTPAHLILSGGCPMTIVAYRDGAVVWDERDGRACDDPELPVPLVPGEVSVLSHAVADDAVVASGPPEAYRLAVRVALTGGDEVILEANP